MEYVDRDGKFFLIYMDAEFQTYRCPKDDDQLGKAGFRLTTPFIHFSDDYKFNTYQFLLNIAFVLVDPDGSVYFYVATFPSLLNTGDGFTDGRILEPAYTVCSPSTLKEMMAVRPAVPKFSYLSSIDEDKKRAFLKMNTLYLSEFDEKKVAGSLAVVNYLLRDLVPISKFIHKGNTDLDAIYNTGVYYGLMLPVLNTRNLNHYAHKFVGLYGKTHDKKLDTLQELFCSHDDSLRALRDHVISFAMSYMANLYGGAKEKAVAHNPLVDCVYTYILDIAVGKYLTD